MRVSSAVKRIGVAAIFIAEVVVMVVIAYGSGEPPADGVMVGAEDVAIQVEDQQFYGAVAINRVLTPVDGWVIVRADGGDGTAGPLVGAAPVNAGENRSVSVAVDRTRDYSGGVFVSLVADKGAIGTFEYTTGDPADTVSLGGGAMGSGGMGGSGGAPAMTGPVDKPLVADGAVVTEHVNIAAIDLVYRLTEADMGAAFLVGPGSAIDVQRVLAPADSWVVVIRGATPDTPSKVIGSALVPGGRAENVRIELSETVTPPEVTALLLADLGMPGILEADPVSPSRGADAPYIVYSYFVQIGVTAAE